MIFLDSLPPESHAEYALVYEARAVHDTATLRLSDYGIAAKPAWIVTVVTPANGSGSATIPGAYIEAETGQFVTPERSDTVVVKKGAWQALDTADPLAPKTGNYSWTEPLDRVKRVVTPEDIYSPFSYGGTIVFRPEPKDYGARYFVSCRLLFPEWGRAAAEALKAAPQLMGSLTTASTDNTSWAMVEKLAADDNGVLATVAFRTLLQSPGSFVAWLPALLKATDVKKLSTFAYLSLAVSSAKDRAQRIMELGKLINETKEADRLLAIAYAAFAVNLFATQDTAAVSAANEILGKLRKRVEELHIPIQDHSPWFLIFKKSGLT